MAITNGLELEEKCTLSHRQIINHIGQYAARNFKCVAAVLERSGHCGCGESPDYLGWNSKGASTLIEVKVSRSDFLADAKKPWRRNPNYALGRYRYYACPNGLIKKEDLPEGWGLIYVSNYGYARKQVKSKEFNVNEMSMLNELGMMARALRDTKVGVMVLALGNNEGTE
jgi:hypothetical protein